MTKSLIFDTETTGLFATYGNNSANQNIYSYSKLIKEPHLMQLCFMLVDDASGNVEKTYNEYIHLPDDATVTQGAYNVHKITKEDTQTKGVPLLDACMAFIESYNEATKIVGHNVPFDIRIINASICRLIRFYEVSYNAYLKECSSFEMLVNYMQQMGIPICMDGTTIVVTKEHTLKTGDRFDTNIDLCTPMNPPTCPNVITNFVTNKPIYDTMKEGKKLCMLMTSVPGRKPMLKNPKLSELYNKLYPHEPMDISKLHNALYDVEITYKCYMKMMTLLSIE